MNFCRHGQTKLEGVGNDLDTVTRLVQLGKKTSIMAFYLNM